MNAPIFYSSPQTLTDALALLSDAATPSIPMSGGTVVYAQRNRDELSDARIVDLSRIPELAEISIEATAVRIGAAVTYAQLLAMPVHPLVQRAVGGVTGGPQILNQGTPAGSACFANPASDVPTALVALGAQLTLMSLSGPPRVVAAGEFFVGPFRTLRRRDELLTTIRIPRAAGGDRWGYDKLKFGESSWPIAVAAARIESNGDRSLAVSLTIGAATAVPIALPAMPIDLIGEGRRMSETSEEELRRAVRSLPARWWSDELAGADYRQRIAETIAVRAIEQALAPEVLS